MSRSPFGVNDSPSKALNLGETADSCAFCAKDLARRARWQRIPQNILWLSRLQFLTAAKVHRSLSSLPKPCRRNAIRFAVTIRSRIAPLPLAGAHNSWPEV